ncbi:separin, partial [Olea europaea subsp. europaea]
MKSVFDLMNEGIGKLYEVCCVKNNRETASTLIKDVSNALGNSWLREYQCLLPGKLESQNLSSLITRTVEEITQLLPQPRNSRSVQILTRALSAIHLLSTNQIYSLILEEVIDNEQLAERLAQRVALFKSEHEHTLSTATRYPVILMVEDALDRLPWETTKCLRCSPVTRVHCLQFVLTLLKIHCCEKSNVENCNQGAMEKTTKAHGKVRSTMVGGYKIISPLDFQRDAFSILNPARDLPSVEKVFTTFLNQKFGSWK